MSRDSSHKQATGVVQWLRSFERLSLRERLLLLLTLVVAISMPTWVYVIEPMMLQKQTLEQRIARLQMSNAGKTLDIQTLQQPAGAASSQLAELRAQLADMNAELRHDSPRLVSPAAMMQLLQEALLMPSAPPGGASLQLLSLSKPAPGATTTDYPPGVYQHPLTLVVSGPLPALQAYLETLEGYKQRFFWEAMDVNFTAIKAGDQQARLTLRLHTLSTEPGWLAAAEARQLQEQPVKESTLYDR